MNAVAYLTGLLFVGSAPAALCGLGWVVFSMMKETRR